MKLIKNCRDITALTLQSMDRSLSWRERLSVRMHMMICAACPGFANQARFMRASMTRWKSYSERDQSDLS